MKFVFALAALLRAGSAMAQEPNLPVLSGCGKGAELDWIENGHQMFIKLGSGNVRSCDVNLAIDWFTPHYCTVIMTGDSDKPVSITNYWATSATFSMKFSDNAAGHFIDVFCDLSD